jgi:hypothetical protein
VQALAVDALQNPSTAAPALAELDAQWRAFTDISRESERDYVRATESVDRAVETAKQQRQHDSAQLLRDKSALLAEVETQLLSGQNVDQAALSERWAALGALGALDETLEQRLNDRFEGVRAGAEVAMGTLEANALQAQQLALLIEFLQGRPSPPVYAATRMEFQVKRLAAHLGGTAEPKEAELAQALQAFLLLGPLLPAVRQDAQERVLGQAH